MTEQQAFNVLVERAMMTQGRAHMRPVIEKELLHYDILFALDQSNLLDHLTFQGGTALRLCYGSSRCSEDLDFTGGINFTTNYLMNMKNCIEKYLGERYGLEVTVKEPAEFKSSQNEHELRVDKWQISVTTSPERRDLPRQKIKIEVINIQSYSRVARALQHNYDFLPDGYNDTLILTESPDEIMADKLISFVNCSRYVRHRDIWDLRWLKQQGAVINPLFIQKKIADYHITDYREKLENTYNSINEIIKSKEFIDEMSRFIPSDVQERTLRKEKFLDYLIDEIKLQLNEVNKLIFIDKMGR
ncbi:MAG: nucleotidyl transferase AbiEii/AbiGii toxin family protein [Gammaproteobacteria bacterium]|nr:nucleotidyl transferase AbiEii/AbiGii toxin family protein [Gammaproteobacteria bacterium]